MNALTPSDRPALPFPQSMAEITESLPVRHAGFAEGALTQAKAAALLDWLDYEQVVAQIHPRLVGKWRAFRLLNKIVPTDRGLMWTFGALGAATVILVGLSSFFWASLGAILLFLLAPAGFIAYLTIDYAKDAPRYVAQLAATAVIQARAAALPAPLQQRLIESDETPEIVQDYLCSIQSAPARGASLVQASADPFEDSSNDVATGPTL